MKRKPPLYFKLMTFVFFIGLFSCEVPYDNNARLLVKGQIRDENNQPISGAQIRAYVEVEFLLGSVDENIGATLSQENGEFEIISLLGRDEDFIVDVIVNENYTRYQYRTDLTDFTPTNYLIDLGLVPIKRRASLAFNMARVSPEGTELKYTLEYIVPECRETYFEEALNEEESFCYMTNSNSGILTDENPDLNLTYVTTLGSEVRFTYSINGQPQVIQQIVIDNVENEFNFEY